MPKKRTPKIGYRHKGSQQGSQRRPQSQVQQSSTSKESQEETESAEVVIDNDNALGTLQSEWFWEVPSLALSSNDETPTCLEAEAFEYKEDSDGAKAHQFFLILHSIYEYQPCENVDVIAEALKLDFLKLLYANLKTCELPSMWTLLNRDEEYVRIVEVNRIVPLVIQKAVSVYPDRSILVHIHNKELVIGKMKHWLKSILNLQISQDLNFSMHQILRIVQNLKSASVCCGNFEQNCIAIYEKGINQPVCKNSYIEGNFQQITCDGTPYFKTIRSNDCSLILQKNKLRCTDCSKIRRAMELYKYKKKLLVSPEKIVGASSTVPFTYLTSDQKTRRLKNVSKALNAEKQLTAKLKKILAKHVEVSANTSQELLQLMTGMSTEESNFNEFQKLLWNQQIKASKLKSKHGMRWHPLIIRWCLSLYAKSPAAYKLLKSSGFLHLPSNTTLYDYSHFVNMKPGFQIEFLRELDRKRQQLGTEDWKKYVSVIHDEIHIKEDLVFDPSTGELIGFVHLDEVGDDLEKLEKKNESPSLATQMLTIMVRGLTSKLLLPVGFFPTNGITADSLYSMIWEAIERIEYVGMKVLAVVCDGSSQNRKFFQMHARSNQIHTFQTTNYYSIERRPLFFISDTPHLIKTARNCFANSFVNKKTRRLWNQGECITWQHIVDVWKSNEYSNWTLLPKLTNDHVYLNAHSCMKVKLAAQILSSSVANAIEFLNIPNSKQTVQFIRQLNKFFDCMNVTHQYEGQQKRNDNLIPYSSVDDVRLEWLTKDFLEYFSDWNRSVQQREGNFGKQERAKMMLSQQTLTGINITCNSFVACCKFLLNAGAKYVLSEKFSQDPVEEYFSKQRSLLGCNDNPSVFQFTHNALSLFVQSTFAHASQFGNVSQNKRENEEADQTLCLKRRKISKAVDLL